LCRLETSSILYFELLRRHFVRHRVSIRFARFGDRKKALVALLGRCIEFQNGKRHWMAMRFATVRLGRTPDFNPRIILRAGWHICFRAVRPDLSW
jgi:hypothetical protein